MAERVKCKKCKTEWSYHGYPAYPGCPNCGHKKHDLVNRVLEKGCKHCGKEEVVDNEYQDYRFEGVQTDDDSERISKEIMEYEKTHPDTYLNFQTIPDNFQPTDDHKRMMCPGSWMQNVVGEDSYDIRKKYGLLCKQGSFPNCKQWDNRSECWKKYFDNQKKV